MTPSEQRTQALANALTARQHTYRLRDQIQAGTVSITTILTSPPPEIHRLTLLDVMAMTRPRAQRSRWQENLGHAAVRDGVNLLAPMGRLSQRDREWAVNTLTPKPRKKAPLTPTGKRRVPNAPRRHMLDATPFCAWLRTLTATTSQEEIARQLGCDPRRVRGWLAGEYATISLTVLDVALTFYGDPGLLHTLYPLTDTEAAA